MVLVDHLLKIKKELKKFKETGVKKYIYKNKTQHDMAYGDFKDLARRAASHKVIRDKAINIAKNPKYDGHQRSLASVVYKYFNKKTVGSGVTTLPNKSAFNNNEKLAEELCKPIIKNFKK